ncbi:MAG TPA: phosphoribosylformylglycinamidine synthase subunit PurQ [Fimbriimonadaceae bacterium]|nr:phosphoribosylformylglycinamidine synthase subunit PurQ [Fimbriimonadaceae bacterium]
MRTAVIRFPGSNCDQDAYFALNEDVGVKAEYVWHDDTSLAGFDAVVIPGGFSYGDYLRCGAMASRSPIMSEVARFATEGRPVIGICNGFQALCEAGLLPGALLLNEDQKFHCETVELEVVNRASFWTRAIPPETRIHIPIAHGEGRYICDADTLKRLHDEDLIAFRYNGNPNGSLDDIAGLVNKTGNVLGLMPHPERATRALLGANDGLFVLNALAAVPAGV